MPSISTVTAISPRKVRVEFSAAVDVSVLTLATSAWSFAGTGYPPFSVPTVSTVDVDSTSAPRVIDLFLTFDLSPGKPYTLAVTGLTGVSAPGNAKGFEVPSLPVVTGRQFTFLSWIPTDDLRKDDTMDLRLFVAILDDMLALLVYDTDLWPEIQDPDLAPEPFIDQMIVDLGNPVEDAVLSLLKKRLLVKSLVAIYKARGTGPGLINTIFFFLGLESSLVSCNRQGMQLGVSLLGLDWILGCGPNRGQLLLRIGTPSGRALTDYEQRVLRQIIKLCQNAHETIRMQAVLSAPTGVTAAASGTPDGITVSWSAVTGATSYSVYERSTEGVNILNGFSHAVSGATSLTLELPSGTRRHFVVVAVNAQGPGLESAEVSATAG